MNATPTPLIEYPQERTGKDSWGDDDFEDTVAAALIACFETKIRKNRGAAAQDRLTDQRVAVIRQEGPYIASNSRLITAPGKDTNWSFDLVNDRLPVKGLHAFKPGPRQLQEWPNAYLYAHYVRQVSDLGKSWHKVKPGVLYETFFMSAEHNGICGERRFFTVTQSGEVVPCDQRISTLLGTHKYSAKVGTVSPDEKWHRETSIWASGALQFLADRRHSWTITAKEANAKAHLGCMQEEVKSLLYARSLPMTSTGRKRPILHLVEAHKRRLRNGTDVDVATFLRGQQTVEIAGTIFSVNPPDVLRPTVSATSRTKYFGDGSA